MPKEIDKHVVRWGGKNDFVRTPIEGKCRTTCIGTVPIVQVVPKKIDARETAILYKKQQQRPRIETEREAEGTERRLQVKSPSPGDQ